MKVEEILEKEGIVLTDKDLRKLRRSEIKRFFGSSNSSRIIMSKFIKSIIWQAYTKIKEGSEPPITGNIRTFWYRWVKPAIAKVPKKYIGKSDLYDTMSQLFVEMVLELKLFHYEDFDFTDENWENRRIGKDKPELLVFAEKRGWIRMLQEYHQEYGVSVLALGGFPSALTSEYTARDITKATGGKKPVRLVGIVDYDPSGALIAQSFREQLERVGLEISGITTIIEPKHYTERELKLFRYPLPRKQKAKTDKWMLETGGILGGRFGLESESMPFARLNQLVDQAIKKA